MFLLFGISFIFSSKREGHAYASFGGAGSRMSLGGIQAYYPDFL